MGDNISASIILINPWYLILGTSVGGWKIIKTVGGKIMKIRPVNGVSADLTGALIIFGATIVHLPVSTTHVISSSILGVGFYCYAGFLLNMKTPVLDSDGSVLIKRINQV